jgi:adenylosuccinate synthase
MAMRAAKLNGATKIALTKLDAVFPRVQGARTYEEVPKDARDFVEWVEKATDVTVALIGTGPDALDLIDRRK